MEGLQGLLETAAGRRRFGRGDKELASSLFGEMHSLLESGKNPPGFRLATGELAKGATGRTALKSYFLLLGRLTLGRDYARMDRRMGYWNMNLGFYIMRSSFHAGHVKGFYCCPTCTISVLPLYCLRAFDAFDCDELRDNVVRMMENGEGRFQARYSRRYADWALRFV
jgi:hypothetical protein